MTPRRIQWRARTRGWRKPADVIYVGRGTKWGNPFDWRKLPGGKAEAVARYRPWLLGNSELMQRLVEIAASDLACWCALHEPCHADVLLELANAEGAR
jgi:hypothetical protein